MTHTQARFESTSTPARRLVALLAAALLGLLSIQLTAPAANAAPGDASGLEGTWRGTYQGFDTGGFVRGQEKIVITEVRGATATGTWQSRTSAKKKWSKPRPINFAVYDEELDEGTPSLYLAGADQGGTLVGKFVPSQGTMRLAYDSISQDVLVLILDMKKK
jgi:hypothetical protein